MTDREIIQGLIARDNQVTQEFFFHSCRPLFGSIVAQIFDGNANYDELVNELYLYLMENDAVRLKSFSFRSSVYQWLKITAIRFFLKKREEMIGPVPTDTLYEQVNVPDESSDVSAIADVHRLLAAMPNQRYALVIRRLHLEGWNSNELAEEMHITIANLYNIKRRAIAQLTNVALNDIQEYGK